MGRPPVLLTPLLRHVEAEPREQQEKIAGIHIPVKKQTTIAIKERTARHPHIASCHPSSAL